MENPITVLVTGGSGAVGANCLLQLLQKGYNVKTTLRDMRKKDRVLAMLQNGGITAVDRLSFIQADLGDDANWEQALQDCTYVLHVASPTLHSVKDEREVTGPAVDGVLRVLRTARDTGIKRVVLTSSFGALGFSNHDKNKVTTEADWTDLREKGLSVYEKSKGMAERAAWKFMRDEGGSLELAVINPVAIFGPLLGPGLSPSFGLLKSLLNSSMKAVPKIPLNVVDIRDVAELHLLAMIKPQAAGQRFIAAADGETSLPEIARLLQTKLPALSAKVSARILPNWVLPLAALFNADAQRGSLFVKINRKVSNAKAKAILGWTPLANQEQAILAAAESLERFGMI